MIQRILEFLGSTALSGFLIIVPLLIMYLIVTELLDVIEGLATTVTSVLPEISPMAGSGAILLVDEHKAQKLSFSR